MKNAIYASLLLGLLVLGPPAANAWQIASVLIDLSSDQMDACGSGVGATEMAVWSFEVAGNVRDPPIPGTYYPVAWKYTPYYRSEVLADGQACFLVGYVCNIQVGDGSHFEIASFSTGTIVTGEYKGVAVAGGTGGCRAGAGVSTYIAGVVHLQGDSHNLPALI